MTLQVWLLSQHLIRLNFQWIYIPHFNFATKPIQLIPPSLFNKVVTVYSIYIYILYYIALYRYIICCILYTGCLIYLFFYIVY